MDKVEEIIFSHRECPPHPICDICLLIEDSPLNRIKVFELEEQLHALENENLFLVERNRDLESLIDEYEELDKDVD